MRVKVLSGAILLLVGLIWAAGTALAVRGTWASIDRPARVATRSTPPTERQLDRAIARAERFVDGLYAPREDGTAAVSEYYGLPVRARFTGSDRWQLLGAGRNRIERVATAGSTEIALATFEQGPASVTGWLSVDWRATPRRASIAFAPLSFVRTSGVELALQGRRLLRVGQRDVGARVEALVPVHERRLFRSHRFTIRHATNDGEQFARYRGQDDRVRRLGAASRAGGFAEGRDVYSALWNASDRWDDDMPFTAAAYADCDRPPRPDDYSYGYVSKTCSVPARAYLWLSSFDPLARMLQGLHVLNRHGDPARPYADRDHLRVRVSNEIGRWEQLFRRQDGMPRCSPAGCDDSWSSGVRTAVFGALETELGYGHGDAVSRTYADRTAALVLRTQTGLDGVVRTADGPYVQPLQAGGFAIAWRDERVLGFSTRWLQQKQDEAISSLAMPREYTGFIASNAETTLAAYAFLVRYRCRRYGRGCEEQFARLAPRGRPARAAASAKASGALRTARRVTVVPRG